MSFRGVPVLALLCLVVSSPLSATPMYTFTDLGDVFGGSAYSYAMGINNSDEVTGFSSSNYSDNTGTAFRWSAGTMTALEGALARGNGINASGDVAGMYSPGGGATHAGLWNGTTPTDLLPGDNISMAAVINDAGLVAGARLVGGMVVYPCVWGSGGGLTDLGGLAGGSGVGYAFDINESGVATGSSVGADGLYHAVIWTDTNSLVDIGPVFSGGTAYGRGINESNQVAGYAVDPSVSAELPFFYSSATGTVLLGLLSGDSNGNALAINDAGDMVGYSGSRAVLFSGGSTHDLNLLTTAPGWSLNAATGINTRGDICGYGTTPDGNGHAFLLTRADDIPEPGTMALMGLGLVALVAMKRGKKA